jgi:hypothetical protein
MTTGRITEIDLIEIEHVAADWRRLGMLSPANIVLWLCVEIRELQAENARLKQQWEGHHE